MKYEMKIVKSKIIDDNFESNEENKISEEKLSTVNQANFASEGVSIERILYREQP